jgi:hypothetical protein
MVPELGTEIPDDPPGAPEGQAEAFVASTWPFGEPETIASLS